MEEDEIELIDYLRVIWKRKILIIVGTLVCIAIGVAMSLGLPVTYRAEALMKVGKVFVSSSLEFIDSPANLVIIIPVEYAIEDNGSLGYNLGVEKAGGPALIKIVLEGPDERKTKKLLGEVVEKLAVNHLRATVSNIQFYKVFIEKREIDIKGIQNDLDLETLELEEMNKDNNVQVDIDKADPLSLMIIQNRSFEILRKKQTIQDNLKQSRINIRSIRDDIFLHQLTINTLKENKTRLVGEVVETCVKPKKIRNIMIAGVVGLTMSLFLAFCMAYLGNVRERGEGEG